jgi:hypothetical protein
MTALAALFLQTVACLGYGALVLRIFKIDQALRWGERASWSFVLGIGVLGWLLFLVGVSGMLSTIPMLIVLILGVPGIVLLGRPEVSSNTPLGTIERVLLAVLLAALALDSLEGVSPPADADSLAYHFATPKLFLEAGRIIFIPRAVDGAAPLLLQMTYTSALGLGGEVTLTLWTMVSGWGAALLLFVIALNHMNRCWALAIALIWLTTPVVLYGGGAGHVEVRNAGFVLLAVAALMRARETGWLRYVAVAGLATGLFIASKYTGLLFAAACLPVLMMLKGWPRRVVVFGSMAGLAGFQWYLWNFIHTGDPVFPMLFPLIGSSQYPYWDAAHHLALQHDLFMGERAIPNTPLSMLAYPFLATFSTFSAFDSERAGMGPFLFLITPFALAGFWRFRCDIKNGPWILALITVCLFYVLWFLSGSSQRVRHLTPLYPVALLASAYLATRWSESAKTTWPLILATLLTLGIQMAGHGASSFNYARHVFTSESRDAFYGRNVSGYAAVKWINANLTDDDKIMFVNRQLNYLIDVPAYYAHPASETFVDIRPAVDNPGRYYRQLQDLGISHILSAPFQADHPETNETSRGVGQWQTLQALGCVNEVKRVRSQSIRSRSLHIMGPLDIWLSILKLDDSGCTIE